VVSFKNTLVLLTSNIGSRVIAASSGGGLAAFGSRRNLMGGGEEGEEALSKAEQVRLTCERGQGLFSPCADTWVAITCAHTCCKDPPQ
jgi:hypothetical protein